MLARLLAALLLAIPLWYLVRDAYSAMVLAGGFRLLGPALDLPPTEEFVARDGGAWFLYTGATRPDGSPERFELRVHEIHANLILFVVLLIATPLRILARRWLRLLVAIVLLVVSHWLVFALGVTDNLGSLFIRRGVPFPLEKDTVRLCGYLVRLHSTILFPLIPLVLFAPIWLARSRPARVQSARSTEKVAPNAPCPCGSGRKYKRCCGGVHRRFS